MEVTRPKEDWNRPQPVQEENKKLSCGILAILVGPLGIHKFHLGYNTEGFITLVLTVFTCGALTYLMGIIEGIIYLTKTDREFYETYQVNKRPWF